VEFLERQNQKKDEKIRQLELELYRKKEAEGQRLTQIEGKDEEVQRRDEKIQEMEQMIDGVKRSMSAILRQSFLDYENHDRHTGLPGLLELIE